MLKSLLQDTRLLLLLLAALLVKIFSLQPAWVEQGYARGLYPFIARGQRLLLGWLPFSFGDLLYAAAGVFLLYAAWRLVRLFRRGEWRGRLRTILFRIIKTALLIYLAFNLLWGLNYNRQGIAAQLGLRLRRYDTAAVAGLTQVLQQRLNAAAAVVDTTRRGQLDSRDFLVRTSVAAYATAASELPFLRYQTPSFKASLYSPVAHWFGYTGYYNPFTGEAQVNTAVPSFLKPFVVCHELAHQLGYGRENEANFVAFLASRHSPDPQFRYALYFDLYRYALRELARFDTVQAKASRQALHPRVLQDNEELKAYFLRTRNPVEPLASAFYDQYLKLNQQSAGLRTYNEVVALLIAYQRKYGSGRL